MGPWYKTETRRSKKERLEEARALSKFWTKAGGNSRHEKAAATHYKTLLKEIEEEIE